MKAHIDGDAAALRVIDELKRELAEANGRLAAYQQDYPRALRELAAAQVEIARLREALARADAAERNVNEALNSGDGVYRP
jgi:chromosome segregation ATPase